MPKFEVEFTPTIESAPALLMEVAALIEKGIHPAPVPAIIPESAAIEAQTSPAPAITQVFYRGGICFHKVDTCGSGGHKRHTVLLPLFIENGRLDALRRRKDELLCDYCWKLGRRRATIRSHRQEAVQPVARIPKG